MQRIMIDGQLKDRLERGIPVELCDAQGKVIATAWPGRLDIGEPPIDVAEIKRMIAEEPTYTTEEVIQYMQEP